VAYSIILLFYSIYFLLINREGRRGAKRRIERGINRRIEKVNLL